MFSGLKQKLGQGLADTANRSLNLVKQDGSARTSVTPISDKRTPSNGKPFTDNLVDIDLSSPASQSSASLDTLFSSTPKTDGKAGSSLAGRSRSSSISSQASDASFLTPQSFAGANQASFVSADDQVSISEAEAEDQSAIFASTTKEEMYRLYTKMQRRGQQYKWKYLQLLAGYRDSEEERKKLEKTLTQTQDKAARRVSELREQAQLDKQAKTDLENNYQLMLDEKDELLQVLKTQVNLLKQGKDVPPELATKLEKSGLEPPVSPSDPAFRPDEAALRDKVKRLETLLNKCKETIKVNKDRTQQMVADREAIQIQLESVQKELDSRNQAYDQLHSQHEEAKSKFQGQLKQARQLIEGLEAEKAMAVAAAKQDLHAALEGKDEELSKFRVRTKTIEAENETLKQKLNELQSSGQERQEKSCEVIRRLEEEKQRLEAESRAKLETVERNLEQVRANEHQELRRGKVEALQVLQRQMDDKILSLQAENATALSERDKLLEEKWKQREALKEAELQARLAARLAEMELAVEDQQLQKTAAVKQQELASQDLLTKITELTEANQDLSLKLHNLRQEMAEQMSGSAKQAEQSASTNAERLRELSEKHEGELKEALEKCKILHEKVLGETHADYSVQIAELQREHEELLQKTLAEVESTYSNVISELKALHSSALEDYRSRITQLQRELAEAQGRVSLSAGEVAQSESAWRDWERTLNAEMTSTREANADLQRQVAEFAERENQLNMELEATKVDRERRIAAQNEAMQQLRTEMESLTASEHQLRDQLSDASRRLEEQVEQLKEENCKAMDRLSEMLQSNQLELVSTLTELESAQRQLAETVVQLNEKSGELDASRSALSEARNELVELEKRWRLALGESELECSTLNKRITSYEQQLLDGSESIGDLVRRTLELESQLAEKDRAIVEFEKRIRDFGDEIGRETASVRERSRQVESLLVDNDRLLREKEAITHEQTAMISDLQAKIAELEAELSQKTIEALQTLKDDDNSSSEIETLKKKLERAEEDMRCFKENVRKQFDERKQKVKLTIERMKAGFEESLRERDELHERDMHNLREQCNRDKEEAVRDLSERVGVLTSHQDAAVSEALARQTEDLDYLKAELASAKVRLRDMLSQHQAEKDALVRRAEADKSDLLQRLESVSREVFGGDQEEVAFSASLLAAADNGTNGEDVKQTQLQDVSLNQVPDSESKMLNLQEKIKDFKLRLDTAEGARRTRDAEVAEFATRVHQLEADLRIKQLGIDEAEEEMKKLKNAKEEKDKIIGQLECEKSALQLELLLLKEQIANQCANLEAKESEISKVSEQSKRSDEDLRSLNITLDSLKEEKDNAIGELEAERAVFRRELDSLKHELEEKQNGLMKRESETLNLSAEIELSRNQNHSTTVELNDLRQKMAEMRVDFETKQSEFTKVSNEINILNEQNLRNLVELEERNSEAKGLREQVLVLNDQLQRLQDSEASVEKERSIFKTLFDEKNEQLDHKVLLVDGLEKKLHDKDLAFESLKERLNAEITELQQQVLSVEQEHKICRTQADSETIELANKRIKVKELEEEVQCLRETLEIKTSQNEVICDKLKALESELSSLLKTCDKNCEELTLSNETQIQELQQLQSLEFNEKIKELEETTSKIKLLESLLKETKESAAAEKADLLLDIEQMRVEIQLLSKKHEQEVAEVKTAHDLLSQTSSVRIRDLEDAKRDLEVQLESTKSNSSESIEEKAQRESILDRLKVQMEERDKSLEALEHRLSREIAERDVQIETLDSSLFKLGKGLRLLRSAIQRLLSEQSDDVSDDFVESSCSSISVDFNFDELVSQLDQLGIEHASLRYRLADLENNLQRLSAANDAADATSRTDLERTLNGDSWTNTELRSFPGEVEELVVESYRELSSGSPKVRKDEELVQHTAQEQDFEQRLRKQHEAHVNELNAIIEDLQQRLLDQEMEAESCRAELRQALNSSSGSVSREPFTANDVMTSEQLRSRVSELTRQLEESNWIHSMEINEIRTRQDGSSAVSSSSPFGFNQRLDENGRLLTEVNRLRNRERELLREVDIARSASRVSPVSAVDNVYAVFGPLLTEPTEIEYLRNILYKYMLGTETGVLAKVICKVMKFTDNQTRHIMDKEKKKEVIGK